MKELTSFSNVSNIDLIKYFKTSQTIITDDISSSVSRESLDELDKNHNFNLDSIHANNNLDPSKYILIKDKKIVFASHSIIKDFHLSADIVNGSDVLQFLPDYQSNGKSTKKLLLSFYKNLVLNNNCEVELAIKFRNSIKNFKCCLNIFAVDKISLIQVFIKDTKIHKHFFTDNDNANIFYKDFFDSTSEIFFSFSVAGSFFFCNNSFLYSMGFDSSSIQRKNFFELIHPNDFAFVLQHLNNLESQSNMEIEFTLLTETKNYIVVKGYLRPKYVNGHLVSYFGLVSNISDLKLSQSTAMLANDRYGAVFNQNFIGLLITDFFGNVLQFNQRFCDIFSFEQNSILNSNIANLFPKIPNLINIIIKSASPKSVKERTLHFGDRTIVYNESSELVSDNSGNPYFILFLYDDITEKKQAFEKIANQSSKLTALLQSNSQSIFTIDKNLKLTSYNETFKELYNHFGLGEIDVNLSFTHILNLLRNKVPPSSDFKTLHYRALLGQPQHTINHIVLDPERQFWLETYIDPIILPNGSIEEVSYINIDITGLKITEEKLRHSLLEKDILLKEVHHRVKNNLQVINSILNLQASFVQDKITISLLLDLQNRIKSMSLIHENLYQQDDLTRLDFRVYVEQLIQNIVQTLTQVGRNLILKASVENVFLNLDYCIPCGLIINELVTNAYKHAFPKMLNGKVFVDVTFVNSIVTISVKDTGVGLKDNFELKSIQSLGLQLVGALVEQIRANIEVSSEQGNGTEFIIRFKLD